MRKKYLFHSIYARFATIFISIWWIMNVLAFGAIMRVLAGSSLVDMRDVILKHAPEIMRVRTITSLIFLVSVLAGTILIMLAVRKIVQPIKKLSVAAGQIAAGDFTPRIEPVGSDEIGRLTDDFNRMARALESIEILRKDFVANVSHEFKTPITAISGFANLIKEGNLSAAQTKDYAQMIASESQRLSTLSASLLRLSELDANLVGEQAHRYSLDEQIRQAVLLLEMQWAPKSIDFDIELEPTMILSCESLLQEVWLNLIGNAIKFSNPGGLIRIRLNRQDDKAVVKIADQGIGIKIEDQPRIFERFFVGDKARGKDSNGMGLAIVKKIVDKVSGVISFVSEPGCGTEFSVVLQINQAQMEVQHVRKNT